MTLYIRDPLDAEIRFTAGATPQVLAGTAWCSAVTNGSDIELMSSRLNEVQVDGEACVLELSPPAEVVHDGQGQVILIGSCGRLLLRLLSAGDLEVALAGDHLELHVLGPGCVDLRRSRFSTIAVRMKGPGEIVAGQGQILEYID